MQENKPTNCLEPPSVVLGASVSGGSDVDRIRVPNSRNITENHLVGSEMVGLGLGQWRNSLGDGKFEPRTPLASLGVCRLWYR